MAEREHRAARVAWERRIAAFEEAEERRVKTADLWYPVTVSERTGLVCAFGGTATGWAVGLFTLGGSLLGSGKRVLIGNLSRRACTQPLVKLAESGDVRVQVTEVGSGTPHRLLAGLSWLDLTDILVEVVHARQRDPDIARRERQLDRAVLRDVAECLADSEPVSIRRLAAALRVVQGSRGRTDFSPEEEDRLTDLYNDVQRQHGDVLQRVVRLTLFLRDLEGLDAAEDDERLPASVETLQVIGVDQGSRALDNELFVDAVFQLLVHQVRGRSGSDALIVLGADRISRQQLEMLGDIAAHEQLQVFLYFEHLREDAVALLGAGGAVACFFALPNPHEAAEAVRFIGTGYKWVESQRSRSVSASLSRTTGNEASGSRSVTGSDSLTRSGLFDASRTRGDSETIGDSMGWSLSESLGTAVEFSSSEQRVNEALVEPPVLMGLPVTCMIYVEVGPGGTRRIANVETNPVLNFADRVAVAAGA